jgi:hypothetical protein
MLGLKQLLYTAHMPEMAYTQLYRHPAYSHPYIYLHDRDIAQLNALGDSFLAQYLPMLPIAFNNSEVKIYDVSKVSFPQPNSDSLLVIPVEKTISEQNLYMAYNILSQGLYNYTVALMPKLLPFRLIRLRQTLLLTSSKMGLTRLLAHGAFLKETGGSKMENW